MIMFKIYVEINSFHLTRKKFSSTSLKFENYYVIFIYIFYLLHKQDEVQSKHFKRSLLKIQTSIKGNTRKYVLLNMMSVEPSSSYLSFIFFPFYMRLYLFLCEKCIKDIIYVKM